MQKVKLGQHAHFFHDQATGISVYPGEGLELTDSQFNSKRVRTAIAGGHLVIVQNAESTKQVELSVEELDKKFLGLAKSGIAANKIAKEFKEADVKRLAQKYDLELEDSDTKATIIQAILEILEENKK